MMDAAELEMWQAYKANPDDAALRNRLIEFYMPLVVHQARLIQAKSQNAIELDFLSQAGVFGLMDAIEGFDVSRGWKFASYATQRIRGSMLDEVRNFDWVPRLVRQNAAKVKQLEKEGIEPSRRLESESRVVAMVSSESKVCETDFAVPVTIGDGLVSREPPPFETSQKADVLKLVTNGMTKNERLIVILYYYKNQTMKEIGKQIGLTESRVSQIHTDLIPRLRARLKDRKEEFV